MKNIKKFIGLELHLNQLEYYKYFKVHKSVDDPEVSSSLKPINPEKIQKRDEEWQKYKETFINSLDNIEFEKYNYMMDIVNKIREKRVVKL